MRGEGTTDCFHWNFERGNFRFREELLKFAKINWDERSFHWGFESEKWVKRDCDSKGKCGFDAKEWKFESWDWVVAA